jgi:Zn-dependent protease with chaperone function
VVRPDRTALCSLVLVVLFLPVAAACLLPVALLVRCLAGLPLWAAYGFWFASAACYTLRPAQVAMARLLWPVRRPTAAERERLERIWQHVSVRAGVGDRRFQLRVVDLPQANAHSIGRDLVCVTIGALDQLGDRELAGVLAHELGHHLRMHTATSAFLVWVLLPLQCLALLGSVIAALAPALGRLLGQRAAADLGRLIGALFGAPGAAAFAIKNAAGRGAEYRVDAFAVDIGLGAELLSALRWFAADGSATDGPVGYPAAGTALEGAIASTDGVVSRDERHGRARRARHAAARVPRPTHPPLDRRMARIAARVDVCGA